MDEKLKSFVYRKADGSKSRRTLYIVHESGTHYMGFDFDYLTKSEQAVIRKVFDSMPITPPPPPNTTRIDYSKLGINKALFKKSYRTFIKENII